MTTPQIGSEPLNQPSPALVSLPLTESQAEKIGLGDRWRIARKKILSRQQHRTEFAARLQSAVESLLEYAQVQSEPLSQRKLAKKIGFSWTTWIRCRRGQINTRRWLPKLEAASTRLKAV